jgi:hypothetical protein
MHQCTQQCIYAGIAVISCYVLLLHIHKIVTTTCEYIVMQYCTAAHVALVLEHIVAAAATCQLLTYASSLLLHATTLLLPSRTDHVHDYVQHGGDNTALFTITSCSTLSAAATAAVIAAVLYC